MGDSIMKSLYDAARHLVWLTQFGLSVVIPPVVCIIGAVWLRRQLQLGGWIGKTAEHKEPPSVSFNKH